VKLCGISDIECYQRIFQHEFEKNLKESGISACNCLSPCTSISYDAEINQIYMNDDIINISATKYFVNKNLSETER
jgi:Amiloride-sensitive sodium channel